MPISLPAGWPARALSDVADALSFFTRLPLSRAQNLDGEAFAFAHFAWAAPLAGGIVGAIGAAAGAVAAAMALPMTVRAVVAVAAMALVTGAMHEDGFADCIDGFGGGRTKDDKLAIMRDSRLGTYGVLALTLAMIAKVSMSGILLRAGLATALPAFIVTGAAARMAALAPLALLAPARGDGLGTSARLPMEALLRAGATLAVMAFVAGLPSLGVINALFACVLALAAAWGVARLAQRQIGGQTGDVAGAAALLGELAALAGLLVAWRGP